MPRQPKPQRGGPNKAQGKATRSGDAALGPEAAASRYLDWGPMAFGFGESGVSVNYLCNDDVGQDGDEATVSSTGGNVSVAEDDVVICTFTNSKEEHITINKVTVPSGGQGFGFKNGIDGTAAGLFFHARW